MRKSTNKSTIPLSITEAEYGLRLKKDVIPLRLQPRYHPDGWLGRLVGSKLAFDFTSEDNIDNMMPNLVRELNARGRVRGTLSECSSMEGRWRHRIISGLLVFSYYLHIIIYS